MEELVKYETSGVVNLNAVMTIGKAMTDSKLFPDIQSQAQAVVKILAGAEVGIGPFASMSGIHIIQGKAEFGAGLLAAVLRRSGRYTYKVKALTDSEASIDFFERSGDGWELIGNSTFTAADAKRQGTKNMDKFPRNMLFARALTNGIGWFCPDVATFKMFSEGELSGAVAESEPVVVPDPEVVEGEVVPERAEPNGRPWGRDKLTEMLNRKAGMYRQQSDAWLNPPSDGLRGAMVGTLEKMLGGEDERHTFLRVVFGDPSSKNLDHAAVKAVLDWWEKDEKLATEEGRRLVNAEIQKHAVAELFG